MDSASRGALRGQITKLSRSVLEYLKIPQHQPKRENAAHFDDVLEELEAYENRLTVANEQLRKVNEALRITIKAEDLQRESEAVVDYEDKVANCLSRIKLRLERIRSLNEMPEVAGGETSIKLPVKPPKFNSRLPKIELKRFSGDQAEWLPFWEQYKTLVHENNSLSASDKFYYLQSCLRGKAITAITGFPPTAACYDAAISLLQQEFADTDNLVDKYMQQLMSLPSVCSREDAPALRKLYNAVVINTRVLTGLGVSPNKYSAMLKTILLNCLPKQLRVEFYKQGSLRAEEEKDNEVGSGDEASSVNTEGTQCSWGSNLDSCVKNLLRFIKREMESLEKAGVSANSTGMAPAHKSKLVKTAAGLLAPNEVSKFCALCKSVNHYTDKCCVEKKIEDRKAILKREGRCFKCTRRGHTASKCTVSVLCDKCKGRHATSMCEPKIERQVSAPKSNPSAITNLFAPVSGPFSIFLQTACAHLLSPGHNADTSLLVRFIIDNGSQRSYIKESIVEKLRLPVLDSINIRILPFGSAEKSPVQTCNRVRVTLRSIHDGKLLTVIAIVVPEICLDTLPIPDLKNPKISKFILADSPANGKPYKGISLLIGSDFYWKVVTGEYEKITESLVALNTKLGWTLLGPEVDSSANGVESSIIAMASSIESEPISRSIQRLWDLESIGITPPSKKEAEDIDYGNYVRSLGDGYEASLLWNEGDQELDDYCAGAFIRFRNLVKKLSRDPEKLSEYDGVLRNIILDGYAEEVQSTVVGANRCYYMPHRPVYRADKTTTKVRPVFDASAHSPGRCSLNDLLNTGPNLLPDILTVLLQFRKGKFAVTADIEKAFLQIYMAPEDRDVHRFFWFSQPISDPFNLPSCQLYRMTRVTFGVKCSPFLLGAVLQMHLARVSSRFPEICSLLKKSFYMDDLVLSVDKEEQVTLVHESSSIIFKEARMNIRKWNSNSSEFRKRLREQNINPPEVQKILGVTWYCVTDELTVDLGPLSELISSEAVTKRFLLKFIARFFDPFGILAPFTIKPKILFQAAWRLKLPWDLPLPSELMSTWNKLRQEFLTLENISIPRCLRSYDDEYRFQLHIFADASPAAYGAVAYLRAFSSKEGFKMHFLCSRGRVAPLKGNNDQLTLPKLELTAALLAARLKRYLAENLCFKLEDVVLWSDSKITLHWITGDVKRWNVYVRNRVEEIRLHTQLTDWKHCPGGKNPADFLTRGLPGKSLAAERMWLQGPDWLLEADCGSNDGPPFSEEVSLLAFQLSDTYDSDEIPQPLFNLEDFSSYTRVVRVTAYVLRFIWKVRGQKLTDNKFLIAAEIDSAEQYWLRYTQRRFFASETRALAAGKPLPNASDIVCLRPYLDDKGLMRLGSRLQSLSGNIDDAFPIILPKIAFLTNLIISDVHLRTLHGGVNAVMARLRERFWILKGRPIIKKLLRNCGVCRRLYGKPANHPFAPLPRARLVSSRPFETSGIDFAGPLYVKNLPEDGKTRKVYILLFTCAAVRAVHLEITESLNTESCLLAIRRFIARRGSPKIIISDNARTFKRAARELQVLHKVISSEEFQGFFSNRKISWEFIVERAPWWGGFWERLIRSVKNILKVVIGRSVLSLEELRTVVTEAEALINERPLTYISEDPLDLNPLSPSKFLVPESLSEDVGDLEFQGDCSTTLKTKWKSRRGILSRLWKRWKTEYVRLLRSFHLSKNYSADRNLKKGEVVLVFNENMPRVFWKLAVVDEIFPGRDGKVRACSLRFSDGSCLRRPVQLLYPLEMRD